MGGGDDDPGEIFYYHYRYYRYHYYYHFRKILIKPAAGLEDPSEPPEKRTKGTPLLRRIYDTFFFLFGYLYIWIYTTLVSTPPRWRLCSLVKQTASHPYHPCAPTPLLIYNHGIDHPLREYLKDFFFPPVLFFFGSNAFARTMACVKGVVVVAVYARRRF